MWLHTALELDRLLRDGKIRATAEDPDPPKQDPLPYEIDYSDVLPGTPPVGDRSYSESAEWARDYAKNHAGRQVFRVQDGWLVGFNAGEWEGSLWWFPEKEGAGVKLWDDNIVSIVRRPDTGEILVLTGLAHDDGHRGAILSAKRLDGGVWSIEELVDLPSAPRVHVFDNERGLLITTPRSIVRFSSSDELEVLANGAYDSPYTLVIAPNGNIFVGLRFFVLRLRPTVDGYEQDWFIPPECSRFHYEEVFCICDGVPISEELKSLLEETRRIK